MEEAFLYCVVVNQFFGRPQSDLSMGRVTDVVDNIICLSADYMA
jgi:hypothetical protein